MSEAMLKWVEIIFDLCYLATIWTVVLLMFIRRTYLNNTTKRIGILFLWMFFLLALGDTGHVGFRVIAFSLGSLEANPVLVGLGALATAVTITFFYMLGAELWRIRFNKKRTLFYWILIVAGLLRLVIMLPSGNDWGSVVPPFGWSLARNIPLMVQGILLAILIFRDASLSKDLFAKKISYTIFLSYLFYLPVILFL